MKTPSAEEMDPLTYRIIGCAIAVHKELGPGLLESVYEECMAVELKKAGLSFRRQVRVSVAYEGALLHRNFRPDFIVQESVVLEVKSVSTFLKIHEAQLLTYMKLSAIERGLLINFNVAMLIKGVKRYILTKAGTSFSS